MFAEIAVLYCRGASFFAISPPPEILTAQRVRHFPLRMDIFLFRLIYYLYKQRLSRNRVNGGFLLNARILTAKLANIKNILFFAEVSEPRIFISGRDITR